MSDKTNRRTFLRDVGLTAGVTALAPAALSACNRGADTETTPEPIEPATGDAEPVAQPIQTDPLAIPQERPADWDAITFNRDRGNAGAIPESYRDSINGAEGENGHLGKHLPFIPDMEDATAPEGFLALMWGNAELGHARHPNSPTGTEGYERGHWYDWVKVRKAVQGEAQELETTFTGWPEPAEGQTGQYAVQGGGEITEDTGKNTIYLVQLPPDVAPGDTIRIHAHCLYHGEYVDFLNIPLATAG